MGYPKKGKIFRATNSIRFDAKPQRYKYAEMSLAFNCVFLGYRVRYFLTYASHALYSTRHLLTVIKKSNYTQRFSDLLSCVYQGRCKLCPISWCDWWQTRANIDVNSRPPLWKTSHTTRALSSVKLKVSNSQFFFLKLRCWIVRTVSAMERTPHLVSIISGWSYCIRLTYRKLHKMRLKNRGTFL